MGKISVLTGKQKIVIDEIKKEKNLASRFYLTGGTALSAFHLQHRYSDDLDLFSDDAFDKEKIVNFIKRLATQRFFPEAGGTDREKGDKINFIRCQAGTPGRCTSGHPAGRKESRGK